VSRNNYAFIFRDLTEVRDKAAGGTTVSTKTFFDGLGRPMRREMSGARGVGTFEVSDTIAQRLTYALLGESRFESRPWFIGAPAESGGGTVGTTLWHDALGRARFARGPDGGVAEVAYTKLLTTRIDPEGRKTKERRDGQGRIIEVIEVEALDAGGEAERSTRYLYDVLGRLRGTCDAVAAECPTLDCSSGACRTVGGDPKHAILIDYDSLGRKTVLRDPDLGVTRYVYDHRGNLTGWTDARGRRVARVYDSLGRLKCENARGAPNCDESQGGDIAYAYGDEQTPAPPNGKDRIRTVRTPTATYTFDYDEAGRLRVAQMALRDQPTIHSRSWAYDWLGRPTTAAYPDGEELTYAYDRMGIQSVTSSRPVGNPRRYVTQVWHNAEGSPSRIFFGNTTIREIFYNPTTGRADRVHDFSGTTNLFDRSYSWDRTSRVTSISDAIDQNESLSSILYDSFGRLKSVTRGVSCSPSLVHWL
jgi:YD repeat-containing protein